MHGRGLVVIGGSAGALEALRRIVGELPADFPAAILVVVHYPATATSVLPDILSRSGKLSAFHVADGEEIVAGRIGVAPPGSHVLVDGHRVRLSSGPYENAQRPSIDVLFRTAASAYGARTVGIIVSGMLDDGTAGLRAIARHGGTAVVQDPDEAAFGEMPRSAAQAAREVRIAGAQTIGRELPGIVAALGENGSVAVAPVEPLPTRLSCSECGGPLEEYDPDVRAFRCRIGHAFTIGTLAHLSGRAGEASLWAAVRANDERGELLVALAKRAELRDDAGSMHRYLEMANEAQTTARRLREIIGAEDPHRR